MSDRARAEEVRLEDYRPPAYRTPTIELDFALDPRVTRVRARQRFVRQEGAPPDAPLMLHGDGLDLLALDLDGRALGTDAYRIDGDGHLHLTDLPASFTLETETAIRPDANTALSGLYVSNGMFCTQCEAEGFRRITFAQDRPDVMARYKVRIEAQKEHYPQLLSNGNLIETGDLADCRHYAVWDDPFPKPSYLFALVAGDLAVLEDSHTTPSGRKVALRIYSEHDNIHKCRHAMEALKKAMVWDEKKYGLECDLDLYQIVAVNDFNMGAMENKGLNIFNSAVTLADTETATDQDFLQIERIIAHEYFHNWTGNRVTCRDWFQLTLKEGLTVFRDQQFTADMHSSGVKRIGDVAQLRETQFPEDAGPLAHPVRPESYIEINNFYTRTVYDKGAEVIRMIHTMIGEEAFRRGIDLYFARHDGEAVTCEDFVEAMADASGRDLAPILRWYRQAGTPTVKVERRWDPATGRLTLDLGQSTPPTPAQPEKAPVPIPIRLGLVGRERGALPLQLEGENAPRGTERVIELDRESRRLTFTNLEETPVPSLLRGFSAPVKLELDLGDDELGLLLARDEDDFARWEAGQTLALRVMRAMLEAHRRGEAMAVDPQLSRAMAAVLERSDDDPTFIARAATLPSRGYFAQGLEVIDVEGVDAVARTLKAELGRALAESWRRTYDRLAPDGPYAFESAAVGRRALRNTALGYLVAADPAAARPLVEGQYHTADNMTDRLAGLRAAADHQAPGFEALLEDFYERWKDDPLVVNKWLAIQAGIEDEASLDRVERLMHHPAFTLSNPNRVRALVGMFAMANMTGFHRADGSGYRFLADRVIEIDRRNPQLGSRLATAFGRWRRYDEVRQGLMRAELERIAATSSLSRDLYEIATKTLG